MPLLFGKGKCVLEDPELGSDRGGQDATEAGDSSPGHLVD